MSTMIDMAKCHYVYNKDIKFVANRKPTEEYLIRSAQIMRKNGARVYMNDNKSITAIYQVRRFNKTFKYLMLIGHCQYIDSYRDSVIGYLTYNNWTKYITKYTVPNNFAYHVTLGKVSAKRHENINDYTFSPEGHCIRDKINDYLPNSTDSSKIQFDVNRGKKF